MATDATTHIHKVALTEQLCVRAVTELVAFNVTIQCFKLATQEELREDWSAISDKSLADTNATIQMFKIVISKELFVRMGNELAAIDASTSMKIVILSKQYLY